MLAEWKNVNSKLFKLQKMFQELLFQQILIFYAIIHTFIKKCNEFNHYLQNFSRVVLNCVMLLMHSNSHYKNQQIYFFQPGATANE